MKRFLTVALAVVLLAAAIILLGVRSSDRGDGPQLQTGPSQTTPPTQVRPTEPQPTETEPPQPTQPPETEPPVTEPPVQMTIGPEVSLLCQDYFVYDCESGSMMAISRDPEDRMYPASITKLFTAHVALLYLDPETVITAGDELSFVAADSSIAYIKSGHKLTAEQLVEGMLLPSGNDAAYVLAAAAAEAYTGNEMAAADAIACFVERMNAEAARLGMTGTHFVNPDGYHHDDHYTTCTDLITMAHLALENEIIRRWVGTSRDDVVYASGHTNTWHNTNLLIDPESEYYCPAAIGLKTGNTGAAGYCLLSAFEVEGEWLIMGVFGCPGFNDRYADSLVLYELALDVLT